MGKKSFIFVTILFLFLFNMGCQKSGSEKKSDSTVSQKSSTIEVGDQAPDFTLKNQEQLNISLIDFLNKKNVILVFYPADFTPVWTGELSEYRENYKRLQELETEVFGISVDSYASHKRFIEDLKLPFDLLSDWDREVAKSYGAFNENEKVANRYSFLIDKKGKVRFTQKANLNEPRIFKDMLNQVEELNNE